MSTKVKKYPGFFKTFVLEQSSKRLHIPNAFIAVFTRVIPKNAILRIRNGRFWHVKVCRSDNNVFFEDGWEEFVDSNSLEERDFLVFHYSGNNIFDLKIFGKSWCEKMEKPMKKIKTEEEKEDEEEEEEEEEEETDEDKDEENEIVSNKKLKTEHCSKGSINNMKGENTETEDDAIDPSQYVQPTNPYFVAKPRKGRRNELHVPLDVIEDYHLKLPKKIILRDPLHRDWDGKVVHWEDGRVVLHGWTRFYRRNFVKDNDRIICEFLPGRDRSWTIILVHIVRMGSG